MSETLRRQQKIPDEAKFVTDVRGLSGVTHEAEGIPLKGPTGEAPAKALNEKTGPAKKLKGKQVG
jgi:hypothetical protein